jgi:hypothetical protein
VFALDASATPFVCGYCSACAKQVLTWLDLSPAAEEYRRCLECDAIVDEALQPAGLSALEAQGYAVRDPAAKPMGCGCTANGCARRAASD